LGNFSYTDIENIKAWPDVFEEGERVYMTEKLHGTCCVFHLENGILYVASKGFAAKGLALEPDDQNFYWRIAKKYDVESKLLQMAHDMKTSMAALYAEGVGVQDLKYGYTGADAEARFFDLSIGQSDGKQYLSHWQTRSWLEEVDLPAVPLVYEGPFNQEVLDEATSGGSLVDEAGHLREGVVVSPHITRRHENLGRVILKSVSPAYLTRKGDATEYE
jgi:RNA ligase (TIGR02306 family)